MNKLYWANSTGKAPSAQYRLDYFQGGYTNPPRIGARFYFLDERKRVTLVPQTGQTPWAILRPLEVSLTAPFFTIRFVRHLTQ